MRMFFHKDLALNELIGVTLLWSKITKLIFKGLPLCQSEKNQTLDLKG